MDFLKLLYIYNLKLVRFLLMLFFGKDKFCGVINKLKLIWLLKKKFYIIIVFYFVCVVKDVFIIEGYLCY